MGPGALDGGCIPPTTQNPPTTTPLASGVKAVVARAIPMKDVFLNAIPLISLTGLSRVACAMECPRYGCHGFNYRSGKCELLGTYLCAGNVTLTSVIGGRYYDVETGNNVQMVDVYREEPSCLLFGRCSPKCYMDPSHVTSLTPTREYTTATTVATTTSARIPGPGDVLYPCASNADCLVPNSDCRNGVMCECVAGYGYDPASRSCVTACPVQYGDTFHKTVHHYLLGNNYAVYAAVPDKDTCLQHCLATPGCVSIDFDNLVSDCMISKATKNGNELRWMSDPFFDYYERNCG